MGQPPSFGSTACCIGLAVAVAVATCVGVAFRPFQSSDSSCMNCSKACGTGAASAWLPGLCVGSEEPCLPDHWVKPIEPGELLRPDQLEPRWEHDASLTSNADVVTAWCGFVGIDLVYYTATLSCGIDFWGRFVSDDGLFVAQPWPTGSINNISDVSLVLLLGPTKVELKNDDLLSSVEVNLSLGNWWERPKQQNTEYYPDLLLPFHLYFRAFWWNDTSNQVLKGDTAEPPFVVLLDVNYIPLFLINDTSCSNYSLLSGFIQLSDGARAGVRLLNGCMWCLAAVTLAMSLVWCCLRNPHEHLRFDLMCFSAALLFALPSLRGLLPAAPVAGTSYDALNVHGQLALVTASILLQVAKMLVATVNDEWRRQRRHNELQPLPPAVAPPVAAPSVAAPPAAAPVHYEQQQVVSVLSSWVQQPFSNVRRCLSC